MTPAWRSVPSLFDGVPQNDVFDLLTRLPSRHFVAGSDVIVEGDQVSEMYFVRSGVAQVVLLDRYGRKHEINQVGPGGAVREMSLVGGQPA